ISNENVGLVSILLFSTAIILSSLEPWKRGSWLRSRLIIGGLGLWLVFRSITFLDEINPFGGKILGSILIIWVISIPTILNIFSTIWLWMVSLLTNVSKLIRNYLAKLERYLSKDLKRAVRIGLSVLGFTLIFLIMTSLLNEPWMLYLGGFLQLPLLLPVLLNWVQQTLIILGIFIRQTVSAVSEWIEKRFEWIFQNRFLSIRIFSFIAGLSILLIGEFQTSNLVGVLLLLFASFPTLLRWGQLLSLWIFEVYIRGAINFMIMLYQLLINTLNRFVLWLRNNQWKTIQIILSIAALVTFLFAPRENNIHLFGAGILFGIGNIPTRIPFLRRQLRRFVMWIPIFMEYIQTPSRYTGWLGILTLIGAVTSTDRLLVITLVILSTCFLAYAWDFAIIRLVDKLVLTLFRIVYTIRVFAMNLLLLIRYMIRQLNRNRILSIIGWALVILSLIFPVFSISTSFQFQIQLLCFAMGIVIWNFAYDFRRVRMKKFLTWSILGIGQRLTNSIKWLSQSIKRSLSFAIQNVLIIFFWLFALFLFYLSVGLIVPVSGFKLSSDLFPGLVDNFLVSFIVSITLSGIAILSIQQSYIRRDALQLKEFGNK
ncbi:MAG: hypothetical protein ACXAB7_03715, partial [Candidatus Kariarchaeaceae archaeon]